VRVTLQKVRPPLHMADRCHDNAQPWRRGGVERSTVVFWRFSRASRCGSRIEWVFACVRQLATNVACGDTRRFATIASVKPTFLYVGQVGVAKAIPQPAGIGDIAIGILKLFLVLVAIARREGGGRIQTIKGIGRGTAVGADARGRTTITPVLARNAVPATFGRVARCVAGATTEKTQVGCHTIRKQIQDLGALREACCTVRRRSIPTIAVAFESDLGSGLILASTVAITGLNCREGAAVGVHARQSIAKVIARGALTHIANVRSRDIHTHSLYSPTTCLRSRVHTRVNVETGLHAEDLCRKAARSEGCDITTLRPITTSAGHSHHVAHTARQRPSVTKVGVGHRGGRTFVRAADCIRKAAIRIARDGSATAIS